MKSSTTTDRRGMSILKYWVTQFLSKHLSPRIKRLIFLSSAFSLFENTTTASDATLNKLNSVLKLAHNQDAIAFPMYIRSWLWTECEPQKSILVNGEELCLADLLKEERSPELFGKLARYLINIAPAWLVYSDDKMITKDIEILLRRCSSIQ